MDGKKPPPPPPPPKLNGDVSPVIKKMLADAVKRLKLNEKKTKPA
jgi:hypothetical protein